MTMTEKILARHSSNVKLVPGENIWTDVDKLLTHDVCGPPTFGIFEKEFGEGAQARKSARPLPFKILLGAPAWFLPDLHQRGSLLHVAQLVPCSVAGMERQGCYLLLHSVAQHRLSSARMWHQNVQG